MEARGSSEDADERSELLSCEGKLKTLECAACRREALVTHLEDRKGPCKEHSNLDFLS